MATTTTTDMAISNFPVDVTRRYKPVVNVQALLTVAADGLWTIDFAVGGTNTLRLGIIQVGQNIHAWVHGAGLWLPSAGTPNLTIVATEVGGSASLTLEAAAGIPRQFWVEDVGPR